MTHTVVIIGTLDTKGPEVAYLRDRLQALGLRTTVIDVGILGEPLGITPDISRAEAATYGGTTIEALRNAGSRGRAVHGMREALKVLVRQLYADGKLDAITGMGGAEGAVMAAAAMMQLPVGVPKVLISPIASGKHYFDPMVGTSDIMVVHSIVDILGLNPIATTIFDNVAAALKGLVEHGHALPPPDPGDRYVAVTMLGNTTKAVMALKERLAAAGYEAVIFHSNGVGGPAMEELAEAGPAASTSASSTPARSPRRCTAGRSTTTTRSTPWCEPATTRWSPWATSSPRGSTWPAGRCSSPCPRRACPSPTTPTVSSGTPRPISPSWTRSLPTSAPTYPSSPSSAMSTTRRLGWRWQSCSSN